MARLWATPRGCRVPDEIERQEIETLAHLEKALLAESDLTICGSAALAERVDGRTRRMHVVANGCDRPRYEAAEPTTSDATRVGYFGPIGPHVDVALVASIAKARPEWTIELAGPASPLVDLSPLAPLANVTLTHSVTIEEMPAKLASFDVCLLPFREIDFSYCDSPSQALDYLAAGKPVVSTPVGQIEGWGDLVAIARGGQEFVATIERVSQQMSIETTTKRRVHAARNTWDVRVAQVADALDAIGVSLHRELHKPVPQLARVATGDRAAASAPCSPLEANFACH